MNLRVALLDASANNPNTWRNFQRVVDADITRFSVVDQELPETFDYDAVVITGSQASVYWDNPWIESTRSWVDEAIDHGLPMLGICWGHQLLADTLDGAVEPMGEYELGYRTVQHNGDPIFENIPETFTVFTTHSDRVVDIPEDATVIAENDYGIHGFRFNSVVGLQSHPEYDQETAIDVVQRKEQLSEDRIQSICDDITVAAYEEAKPVARVFDNFLQEVQDDRPDLIDV